MKNFLALSLFVFTTVVLARGAPVCDGQSSDQHSTVKQEEIESISNRETATKAEDSQVQSKPKRDILGQDAASRPPTQHSPSVEYPVQHNLPGVIHMTATEHSTRTGQQNVPPATTATRTTVGDSAGFLGPIQTFFP